MSPPTNSSSIYVNLVLKLNRASSGEETGHLKTKTEKHSFSFMPLLHRIHAGAAVISAIIALAAFGVAWYSYHLDVQQDQRIKELTDVT